MRGRWEVTSTDSSEKLAELLADGWEPFGVQRGLFLRRLVVTHQVDGEENRYTTNMGKLALIMEEHLENLAVEAAEHLPRLQGMDFDLTQIRTMVGKASG